MTAVPKRLLAYACGDLDVDLESPPGDERGMAIAMQVDTMDLVCMTRQLRQQRQCIV